MPVNLRMDKESVTHLHIRFYSAVKNNGVLNFASKWMELENTILSEVTQTQNDEYGMYSIISGF